MNFCLRLWSTGSEGLVFYAGTLLIADNYIKIGENCL